MSDNAGRDFRPATPDTRRGIVMNRMKLIGYGLPKCRRTVWRTIKVEMDGDLYAEARLAAERKGMTVSAWFAEVLKRDVADWSRRKLAKRIHLRSRPIATVTSRAAGAKLRPLMRSVERSQRPLFIRSRKGDLVMAAVKKPWHR
jgi:hypothetical protein